MNIEVLEPHPRRVLEQFRQGVWEEKIQRPVGPAVPAVNRPAVFHSRNLNAVTAQVVFVLLY